MNIIYSVILSFILGSIYYYIMENSLPKKSNCSFISSKWTDFLAFIIGFIIIYKSYTYDDTILASIGGAIIIEHIWQLLPKYSINVFIDIF